MESTAVEKAKKLAAHLFDGFVSVGGITLPTRHRIHARDVTGRIDTSKHSLHGGRHALSDGEAGRSLFDIAVKPRVAENLGRERLGCDDPVVPAAATS